MKTIRTIQSHIHEKLCLHVFILNLIECFRLHSLRYPNKNRCQEELLSVIQAKPIHIPYITRSKTQEC